MPKGIYKRTNPVWNKGKHWSDIIKNKIGKANKGKLLGENNPAKRPEVREKISKAMKGNKSRLGLLHTKETKEKISKSHLGKSTPWMLGKNNSNWKGGINPINDTIRKSIEMRLWRESVFARDNWTCQKCGQKGGKLHSHHIKNFAQYPKLRFAIDNGTTLCKKCHIKFHKEYGKRNNTKKQLEKFIEHEKTSR